MKLAELLSFIAEEDERLIQRDPDWSDRDKQILGRAVKLSEEVGELSDEILADFGLQREDKTANSSGSDQLAGEVADVLISTLLLARVLDIDVEQALQEKMHQIESRY